jgi:hypothetical protein
MTAESVLNHLIRSTMATFHAAILATHSSISIPI